MEQDKLKFNDGSDWNEFYNVEDIISVSYALVEKFSEIKKVKHNFNQLTKKEIENTLGNLDSYDSIYLVGYWRYFDWYIKVFYSLEEAMNFVTYGMEDLLLNAEFIIDPYEKVIYPDPYVYPKRKVSI